MSTEGRYQNRPTWGTEFGGAGLLGFGDGPDGASAPGVRRGGGGRGPRGNGGGEPVRARRALDRSGGNGRGTGRALRGRRAVESRRACRRSRRERRLHGGRH